jgi:hypothetical protein
MKESHCELVLRWYTDLEERLMGIFTTVPYSEENKNVVLPKIASIIVEAGSLIDTVFREEIEQCKNKGNATMKEYCKYYEENYKLSKLKTLIYQFPPRYIVPFENWAHP